MALGEEIELLHDIHERMPPIQAIRLAKELEQFRLFFLEDPFAPEDNGYFRMLRQQTAIPIAMGELYVNQQEYVPLVQERLIDFMRVHISDIGGLSMARKLAAYCEFFAVRTAWHGPGDASPVAHAANLQLDLSCSNFGIQESYLFPEKNAGGLSRLPGDPGRHDVVERATGAGYRYRREKSGEVSLPRPCAQWRLATGAAAGRDGAAAVVLTPMPLIECWLTRTNPNPLTPCPSAEAERGRYVQNRAWLPQTNPNPLPLAPLRRGKGNIAGQLRSSFPFAKGKEVGRKGLVWAHLASIFAAILPTYPSQLCGGVRGTIAAGSAPLSPSQRGDSLSRGRGPGER